MDEPGEAKAVLLRKRREKDKKKKKAKQDRMKEYESLVDQTLDNHIKEFQKGLERFVREFWESLEGDSDMQKTLYGLCARLGLDPLLMRKSILALELRHGGSNKECEARESFLHALGIAILDVCEAKRELDGGLSDLETVMESVRKRAGSILERSPHAVFKHDVLEAIDILSGLGNSIGILQIGGKEYVKCSQVLFSGDCTRILELFHKCHGRFSRREAMDELGWSEERVVNALMALAREGMVMIDNPPEALPPLYWCPAVKYDMHLCL